MAGRISETAMGGAGLGDLIFRSPCGKKKALDVGGPSSIVNILGGRIRSSEAAMGGGGAQRPVWRVNELKKTGARARARTRGQNPLVLSIKGIGFALYLYYPIPLVLSIS